MLTTARRARSTSPSSTPTSPNYDTYYELALQLLRPGGLIAIDNVLWGGDVASPQDKSDDTVAIRRLNDKLAKDDG